MNECFEVENLNLANYGKVEHATDPVQVKGTLRTHTVAEQKAFQARNKTNEQQQQKKAF